MEITFIILGLLIISIIVIAIAVIASWTQFLICVILVIASSTHFLIGAILVIASWTHFLISIRVSILRNCSIRVATILCGNTADVTFVFLKKYEPELLS